MVTSRYQVNEEEKSIWVFLEQDQGALERVSLEMLCKGRELADQVGWKLVGLLLGAEVDPLVETAFSYGADEVIAAEHALLGHFSIDAYARITDQALMQYKPSIFLLGATPNGRDLAGRLAVRFRTGLNADCTNLRLNPENGVLICEVSGFGGGILALIEIRTHRPQMATVRPGVFEIGEPQKHSGKKIAFPVDLSEDMIQTRVLEHVVGEGIDLTQVPVLVSGGRGIDGRFDLMRELADLLGGDVGATRPPVDEGHIERERQIGQTGAVCRPKIAICCGISGAFHFIVGVEKADVVIAINKDPDAPIFEHADYCVVGDVHQIVPALIRALQEVPEVSYA